MQRMKWIRILMSLTVGSFSPLLDNYSRLNATASTPADAPVQALFDLSSPSRSPFPSDRFTVADSNQNTGRRVALPMPLDCVANESECHDVTFLNQLDGFNTIPRISIPFDGDIDVTTATSETVFIVSLGDALLTESGDASADWGEPRPQGSIGRIIGINQIVWAPETHTLHATADESLDEHSRYALVVTRGVRDRAGRSIQASAAFQRYRFDLAATPDPQLRWYRRALLTAEWAARRAAVRNHDIAVVSLFSTQSATYLLEKVRHKVRSDATPASADFNIGESGSRAVFPFSSIASLTFNRQISVGGPVSPVAVNMAGLNLTPNAVGRIAFGRFTAPDFMVHPGEYIPETPTRNGIAAVHGTNTLYFNVTLPAGPAPPGGWPVAIYGHGSDREKNQLFDTASSLAAHGLAVIAISMVGHGFGPNSTITITRLDGTSATVESGGRGIDQNADGAIAAREGDAAAAPRLLQVNADAMVQNIADLMQLSRVIQAGLDVDDDSIVDLNPDRLYYYGHSLGAMYGIGFFAYTPEVRAGFFIAPGAPLLENRRLSPTQRHQFGQLLAARTPSLLNSAEGLTTIGEIAVLPPFFNEDLPLRNESPVLTPVPGAIAIQQFADRSTWIAQRGSPIGTAPRLRLRPLAGIMPRPFVLSFARGDTASPNPNTTGIIRAGAVEDRAAFYRHDRYGEDNPSVPKNPHGFLSQLIPLIPAYVTIVRGAQTQVAEFFRSDGTNVIHPAPRVYWEVPIAGPLPEDLGYIR
jgi:Bacterial virulence factor lipase N-terminal